MTTQESVRLEMLQTRPRWSDRAEAALRRSREHAHRVDAADLAESLEGVRAYNATSTKVEVKTKA